MRAVIFQIMQNLCCRILANLQLEYGNRQSVFASKNALEGCYLNTAYFGFDNKAERQNLQVLQPYPFHLQ